MPLGFRPIDPSRTDLSDLIAASRAERFRFVSRLLADWFDGSNRFDQPGERLLGAFADDRLVGVARLNRDPYLNFETGRLRHLYVLPEFRRSDIGRTLVGHLSAHAVAHFSQIRLRTEDPGAAQFYCKIGFDAVVAESATHQMPLTPPSPDAAVGLIFKEDTVLLGKRSAYCPAYAGLWDFIGGRLEAGETPVQTIGREMREEIGVFPTNPVFVGKHLDRLVAPKALPTYFFFAVTHWVGGDPKVANEEHTELVWVPVNRLEQWPGLRDVPILNWRRTHGKSFRTCLRSNARQVMRQFAFGMAPMLERLRQFRGHSSILKNGLLCNHFGVSSHQRNLWIKGGKDDNSTTSYLRCRLGAHGGCGLPTHQQF